MIALRQDGIERRYERDGADRLVTFVELHELEARTRPTAPTVPRLVQLHPNGRTRVCDLLTLWNDAEEGTLRDLAAVQRLEVDEATEVYYLDRHNRSPGRIVLARVG